MCLNLSLSRFTQTLFDLSGMREAEIFPSWAEWIAIWSWTVALTMHPWSGDLPNTALLFIAIVPLISPSEQTGIYCSLIIDSSESHLAMHHFSQSHSWEQCQIFPDLLGEFTLEANIAQIDSADSKVTAEALPTTVLYKKGSAKRFLVSACKNIFSMDIMPKFSRLEKTPMIMILLNHDFFK